MWVHPFQPTLRSFATLLCQRPAACAEGCPSPALEDHLLILWQLPISNPPNLALVPFTAFVLLCDEALLFPGLVLWGLRPFENFDRQVKLPGSCAFRRSQL